MLQGYYMYNRRIHSKYPASVRCPGCMCGCLMPCVVNMNVLPTHRSFMLLVAESSSLVGVVIQCCVLHQRSKDKQKADGHKQVHGGDIRHFRQRCPGCSAEGGHRQHCGDTWWALDRRELSLLIGQTAGPQRASSKYDTDYPEQINTQEHVQSGQGTNKKQPKTPQKPTKCLCIPHTTRRQEANKLVSHSDALDWDLFVETWNTGVPLAASLEGIEDPFYGLLGCQHDIRDKLWTVNLYLNICLISRTHPADS